MLNKRIEEGVKFLDNKYGSPEWKNLIDVDRLDLWSSQSCILGQLQGDFLDACDEWGISSYDAQRMGFDVNSVLNNLSAEYQELDDLWVAYLTDKQIRQDWLDAERDAILADMPMTD